MAHFADLHRHLDGSLRRATLQAFAREDGLSVPADLGFFAGMGLAAALACFEVTLSVLQTPDRVRRVADEMCLDAEAEGTTTLEIRFAPQLHHGARPEAIVDAALEGANGRAGLILCGLYGEPPSVLKHLVEIARSRPGVVAIDLAGGPAPAQDWSLVDYAEPFTMARAEGLGRTVHAAEGRHVDEIRIAVDTLHAQRIGHGTTLLDDPAIVDLVIEKGVTIEACITSNLHTGAIATLHEHPLVEWLKKGVKACVCCDNTLLSGVDAGEEYGRARRLPGMSEELLARAVAFGHAGAFSKR